MEPLLRDANDADRVTVLERAVEHLGSEQQKLKQQLDLTVDKLLVTIKVEIIESEKRVCAYVDQKVGDPTQKIVDVNHGVDALEQKVDKLIVTVADQNRQLDLFTAQYNGLAKEQQSLARAVERLEARVDTFTKWLVGLQVTTLFFIAGFVAQLFLR